MNKKELTILIIIGLLLIAGVLWFFFFDKPSDEEATKKPGFFSFLFPDSEEAPLSSSQISQIPPIPPISPNQPVSDLIQLTAGPISGATFNEESQKVFYVQKSTGHLYEINPEGTEEKQRTITTIPKTFEVLWSKDASKAIIKYFDKEIGSDLVKYFVASFSATSTPNHPTSLGATGQAIGTFLPITTSSVTISPDSSKMFYLLDNGESTGITVSFEPEKGLKNKNQIFNSPFTEFLTNWPQKNIITLLTKPSSSAEGYFYELNPQTGTLTKLLGDIKGLTALYSPYNDKILYNESSNKSLTLNLYNNSSKESSLLGLKTLPEKCLFSNFNNNIIYCAVPRFLPSTQYPDNWYTGEVSFSDALWKINTENGSTEQILNSPTVESASEEGLDIINIFSDKKEHYLFFQNKKDMTLWSLQLSI